LSRVRSSLKSLQTLITSSFVGDSPVARTLRKNSVNSSFLVLTASTSRPLSLRVLRRKAETCLRVSRRWAAFFSRDFWPSKVDGRRFGKSFRATGRRNSAKGTMMKTENGTSRPRSWTVRCSCKETNQYLDHHKTC